MKVQKIVVMLCLAALVLSCVASANTDANTVVVNGQALEVGYVEKDGITMIPVRKVCESLGFTVNWDSATNDVVIEKAPLYYTFNVYKDGYTISKTAPILLGTAPYVADCTTYVPMSFAGEIIPAVAVLEDGVVSVTTAEAAKKPVNKVVFIDETEGMYVFYDAKLGNVIANVSDECVISGGDIKAIEKGQILNVVYDEFMTMSLPPITNALEIEICEGETAEIIASQVCEAVSDENTTQIIIGDAASPMEQVALNIGEDTVILAVDGTQISASDVAAGSKVTVVASNAATRSIPPQRAAYSIRISE